MRTLVLHPDLARTETRRSPELALEEAAGLTEALDGLTIVEKMVVPVPKARAGTLFGTGKVEELKALCKAEEIDLVIIDGPVSPIQQRNLEQEWNVKLLDRTGLILEIFGERAQTREGVLQVDLAHLSYQKTRLVRSWTHLERQRGGGGGAAGFLGGPGETQIESDRRAISDQIVRIRKQLSKVVKTRKLHRAARAKIPYPIVALVGYTNAGKSTIFNRMTGAEVLAKDMLFATLDPTMRAITLPTGKQVILSDTVGFISDLPTQLVAAFRATLEEVLDADLILHVRDMAHPETEEQAADVAEILESLGIDEAAQAKMVEIWNKVDAVSPEEADALERMAERDPRTVAISALTGQGMDTLFAAIEELTEEPHEDVTLNLEYREGKERAWLFSHNLVLEERQDEDGYHLDVSWTAKDRAQFEQMRSSH